MNNYMCYNKDANTIVVCSLDSLVEETLTKDEFVAKFSPTLQDTTHLQLCVTKTEADYLATKTQKLLDITYHQQIQKIAQEAFNKAYPNPRVVPCNEYMKFYDEAKRKYPYPKTHF